MALPLELFDFTLPPERIAQEPARPRDASRLLALRRERGGSEHHHFHDLPGLLGAGDLLVVNRTQVIPARLRLKRPTGGKVELLLARPLDAGVEQALQWEALGRPGSALQPGRVLLAPDGSEVRVIARDGKGVRVEADAPLWRLMSTHGEMPLPPYIRRPEGGLDTDRLDYQTMFARELGAVAASTAALHFTERVLDELAAHGVSLTEIILHVGPGTFLPVDESCASDVRQHRMHAEWYEIPKSSIEAIGSAQQAGGRIIAVGTTAVRALETWDATGQAVGESELFIYPGYRFRTIDGMLTNLHLPKSTLLMLVSAFGGRERVMAAYDEAVERGYRFYSYGDAMLLL